jgi:hypothetical protein
MKLHDLNPPILEIPKQERWHRVQRIKAIKCSALSDGVVASRCQNAPALLGQLAFDVDRLPVSSKSERAFSPTLSND